MKKAKITPVFRKRVNTSKKNYRPISPYPSLGKYPFRTTKSLYGKQVHKISHTKKP